MIGEIIEIDRGKKIDLWRARFIKKRIIWEYKTTLIIFIIDWLSKKDIKIW